MCIITGTFAIGWTAELVDALCARGYHAIGNAYSDDPFALLLHRVKALSRNPESVIVATKLDIMPQHPHVERLLADLARVMCSTAKKPRTFFLEADAHDFFAKCIAEGYLGTQHELTQRMTRPYPAYLHFDASRDHYHPPIMVPSYLADTPHLLRAFVDEMSFI